jgi:hypothetical protein
MSKLRNTIAAIGEEMVRCDRDCDGVARRPSEGILPRCLILEDTGRTDGVGAIVCGLNPSAGTTRKQEQEQQYYVEHGASYCSEVEFWNEKRDSYLYFKKLRKLVNALDLTGPILWTDTVKCQKGDDTKSFNHADFPGTVRRCVAKYLRRELKACPPDKWIAIGVGRDAFATLSLVCPEHFVLGVPHCTGLYTTKNDFDALFDKGKLRPKFTKQFRNARDKEPTGALWLTPKPRRGKDG